MSIGSGDTTQVIDLERNHWRSGLANPVGGARSDVVTRVGRIATYTITPPDGASTTPLLLIHSINAAGSAYEVKPLYDYYAARRPTMAVDLPGFGQSDRSDRAYDARLMTDAVHAAIAQVQERYGAQPIDVLALSLACEFVARVALEKPGSIRTLGLISPTGFEGRARDGKTYGTRGMSWLLGTLNVGLWREGFFKLLTARPVIRKFLEKAWGSKNIDEPMVEYDYHTTHQPGAERAPYYFVAGYMFSTDILTVYEQVRQPVWMAHGVRGDFVDYHHKTRIEGRPNWHIDVFQTGAFPHYEVLDQVTRAYDDFVAAHVSRASDGAAVKV